MSVTELIVAYLRQRVRARALVPLAFLLSAAGWLVVSQPAFDLLRLVASVLSAFVIVLTFRAWDDLEDRSLDRRHHPERVMAWSTRTAPFAALITFLGIGGILLLLPLPELLPRLIALAIAAGIVSAWYGTRPSENWNRVVGSHVVLTKYPLIAYAVAPTLPVSVLQQRPVAVLIAIYLIVCVYEYLDDPKLRQAFLVLFSRSTQP
ncbi:MAG TPA: hypothetical protein VK636_18035 [Gemmatimonadaceae bacterium]|nr:hypothetical protein [Gemmatimonadaceae bacterium]